MKSKVEYFQKVYNARWFGGYWNSNVFRKAFGNPSRLPEKGSITAHIISDDGKTTATLFLAERAQKPAKYLHRVMMTCPCCFRTIPAGRIHQHTC